MSLLIGIALFTDIRKQIIPNRVNIIYLLGGIIYQLSVYGIPGLLPAFMGMACGFIPLFFIYLLKGIGAGDVKLFAVIGLWSGALPVLQLTMYAILYAGIIGIILLVIQSGFVQKVQEAAWMATSMPHDKKRWFYWAQSGKKFPFMMAAAPAYVTVWFWL